MLHACLISILYLLIKLLMQKKKKHPIRQKFISKDKIFLGHFNTVKPRKKTNQKIHLFYYFIFSNFISKETKIRFCPLN